ncbi:MAG: hypothetical protein JWP87_6427 [Labilithrix sp.]|nr:hypothetical protein [Labilithrix sp.]
MPAMFLIVRDEDAPTVAGAITAFADEEGLEPIDLDAQAQNPIAMLQLLAGPRALVSATGEQVAAFGLESLDIADAEEWGTAISTACETEVIAIEPAADGIRVYVFDGGELDEQLEVPLDPSGRTRAAQLAELTDVDEGKRELEKGIAATNVEQLLQGVLRCFGVGGPGNDAMMLAFVDPLARGEDDDEGLEQAPHLDVAPLPAASLSGKVGEAVSSPYENVFAVSLHGADPIEGIRLALSGDGLALVRVEGVEVAVRVRDAQQQEKRAVSVDAPSPNGEVTVDLADAFLERIDAPPPTFDMSDMFATMQRLMSAGDAQQLNTLLVDVKAVGVRAGEGSLVLKAWVANEAIAPGEATVPVRVVE